MKRTQRSEDRHEEVRVKEEKREKEGERETEEKGGKKREYEENVFPSV